MACGFTLFFKRQETASCHFTLRTLGAADPGYCMTTAGAAGLQSTWASDPSLCMEILNQEAVGGRKMDTQKACRPVVDFSTSENIHRGNECLDNWEAVCSE